VMTRSSMLARAPAHVLVAILLFGSSLAGCKREDSAPPPQYPGYGQAQYPGQPYPGQPYPAQPAPGQPQAPAPAQPGAFPAPPVATGPDPINQLDIAFLRTQAQVILNELVASLAPLHQARVNGIPLVVDSTPGEVNAFAACT